MSYCLRPLTVAMTLALACSVVQAKPVKPAKAVPAPAVAAQLELAHNLGPAGADRLQVIVDRFNKESGSSLKLVRLEKGDKPAILNLVRRYDMSDVLSQSNTFAPLYRVMAQAGQPLKFGQLSGDLKAGVVDARGRLVALPVLYSTPVLFYNKNAFRKAGLDPEQPPKTWFEMQGMLDKLQDAGYACPYTSSWPVWVHVDNVSAISGAPAATEKGLLTFNGLPQVKHLAMMATWSKANYFKLFGRRNEASAKFHEGECAMITTDSRENVDFHDAKGVELGVAPLPHHDDVYGGRKSSLADGASLWFGAGRTRAQYKQAAKFVNFLLSPEMQLEIVRVYGGLPMTDATRSAARSKLLKDDDKTIEIAYASLNGNGSKPSVRVANIDQVRLIADEELEAVWADEKPAKAALDTSVSRGNVLLAAKPQLKRAQPF
ncbi:MAG: extracellular solute-binding protein [Gammaproteobacteria bacterium]|nr:extracellular solute-binding protein [Gammaproteobacteria bacterium]MBU1601295.1 extracellular solute-binding protein [Gammaproteobacteria bacterium]MBU2433876.1 extracellular solute-binding protein [Gammaproteobacteria bacterium]MBU2450606.1 extracellular solute-binding protein [Gammaproteobacteria bacterium]